MIDLKTGKEMTRRDAIRGGLAAILAAGVAPSLCGSITRGIGYRNLAGRLAAMGGGKSDPFHGYVANGLVACFDGEDGWTDTHWLDLTGNTDGFVLNGNGRVSNHLEVTGTNLSNMTVSQTLYSKASGNFTYEYEVDGTDVANYSTYFWMANNAWYIMAWGANSTFPQFFGNFTIANRKFYLTCAYDRANKAIDIYVNGAFLKRNTNASAGELYFLNVGQIVQAKINAAKIRGFRIYDHQMTQDEITANYNNYQTKTW